MKLKLTRKERLRFKAGKTTKVFAHIATTKAKAGWKRGRLFYKREPSEARTIDPASEEGRAIVARLQSDCSVAKLAK